MDTVIEDIEKWGAISTAVPSVVALLVLFIVIAIAVQLQKINRRTADLNTNIVRLQAELQNLGMGISKRNEDQNGNYQRLDMAVNSLPQTILTQLSTLSRKEYNEEILTRSGALLPPRVVGPPVPPKRANSYFNKPTTYY